MSSASSCTSLEIATGTAKRQDVADALKDAEPKFLDLLNTLCQPSGEESTLAPLPPNGEAYSSILNADGTLLVDWSGNTWKLDPLLQDRLRFFGEQHYDKVFMPRAKRSISKAVLEVLESNHIGKRDFGSLAEWAEVPAVRAILGVLKRQAALHPSGKPSPFWEEFNAHCAGEASPSAARKAAARKYLSAMGLNIVCWVRHVEGHAYISKSPIVDAGLRISVVDAMLGAAVRAWKAAGGVLASGVPDFPPAGAAAK